jgi:hypothetical protein
MTANPSTIGQVPTLEMSDTLQTADSAKSNMNQPLSQTSRDCVAVTLLVYFLEINGSNLAHVTTRTEQ